MLATQSPSSLELAATQLTRIRKSIAAALDLPEIPKKNIPSGDTASPITDLISQCETAVRMMIKYVNQQQKGYEAQLQKLEEKLRKNAKTHCEVKIYCQHLEDQLRQSRQSQKVNEQKMALIKLTYDQQIQSLRTELSHAAISRVGQSERSVHEGRSSLKPIDTVSKIKLRLLNIGNVQIQEPLSCVNTLRSSITHNHEPNSYSQPNSHVNSPANRTIEEVTQPRTKKRHKKGKSNIKSKSSLAVASKNDKVKRSSKNQ